MTGMVIRKVERVWAQSAPTATITLPTGRQLVVCLDCADTLRTSHSGMANQFRDWHLVQHVHVEVERERNPNVSSEYGR